MSNCFEAGHPSLWVWKAGAAVLQGPALSEALGGIWMLSYGWVLPQEELGPGLGCKWFIKELLSEEICMGMGEARQGKGGSQWRSDFRAQTQPDLMGALEHKLHFRAYHLESKSLGFYALKTSIFAYRLARVMCKIPRGKQLLRPKWIFWKSPVQAVSRKVPRRGSGHAKLVKETSRCRRGVSGAHYGAKYGVQTAL